MTSQELQALGFQKAGDVDVVDGVISSNLTPFASEVKSGVYCWVLINDSNKKEEKMRERQQKYHFFNS